MNKCWFVLEQSIFSPPEYTQPGRARGEAVGPLRLGDIVPSPADIYPIITQNGPLPAFPPDMRIWDAPFGDFTWDVSSGTRVDASARAGVPIAAAGMTVDTGVKTTFQKTMKSWTNFEKLDVEIMQPSPSYIDDVLDTDRVKTWISQHKNSITQAWSVFVVTGLMIARGNGSVGHSNSKSTGFGGNFKTEVLGVTNANVDISYATDNGNKLSLRVTTDRIWAIRLAKVHRGFLSSRWLQNEVTIGATLDSEKEGEESIGEVLTSEGFGNVDSTSTNHNEEEMTLVVTKQLH